MRARGDAKFTKLPLTWGASDYIQSADIRIARSHGRRCIDASIRDFRECQFAGAGTRTLKHGDTFAVFDQRGDIGGEPGNSEGLYHRDTRILSQFQLLLEESRPLLLSSMTQDDNAVFSADLSNPDLLIDGRIALRREQIHLHRIKFVWEGTCYERVLVRNFSAAPLGARLTFRFAADFADLFEVRGERRAARGESARHWRATMPCCSAIGASTRSNAPPGSASSPRRRR